MKKSIRFSFKNNKKVFLIFKGNYDCIALLPSLKEDERIWKLECLPKSSEKMRCMQLNNYFFYDTIHFLPSSLHDICNDLIRSGHKFEILRNSGVLELNLPPSNSRDLQMEKRFDLIVKQGKQFYPYDEAKSIEQLSSQKGLPPIELFFSKISNSGISEADYNFAKEVYHTFNCKNLLQYTLLYCILDTFLLLEAFEAFRDSIANTFGLDPSHYISLPALSYDCCLKFTKVKISLLNDVEMWNMISTNVKGGLCQVGVKYAEATKLGVSSKEGVTQQKHLLYLDQNNVSQFMLDTNASNISFHFFFFSLFSPLSSSTVRRCNVLYQFLTLNGLIQKNSGEKTGVHMMLPHLLVSF